MERILVQDAAEAHWRKRRGVIAERRCYDEVAKDVAVAKAARDGVGENCEVVVSAEEIICATHTDKRFQQINVVISSRISTLFDGSPETSGCIMSRRCCAS